MGQGGSKRRKSSSASASAGGGGAHEEGAAALARTGSDLAVARAAQRTGRRPSFVRRAVHSVFTNVAQVMAAKIVGQSFEDKQSVQEWLAEHKQEVQALFDRYDLNGDGVLSQDEAVILWKDLWRAINRALIEQAESAEERDAVSALVAEMGEAGIQENAEQAVLAMDADGDGIITLQELITWLESDPDMLSYEGSWEEEMERRGSPRRGTKHI
eukprot:TRINITY_DN70127_c0_g1_i1.p1 TRINITY_DN70127_c0_g1~~TRINITY_DN70127_c0_g1_i1.p1  ORF type:complete len:239 (+),score=78.61 TRINITY_DN70127_c0_g1_i1:76-717(+)